MSTSKTAIKKNNNTLLVIHTKEGYTFKVVSELLQAYIKRGTFIVNTKGIFFTNMDKKTTNGTVLVDLELFKENFVKFKCPQKDNLHVGVNLMHLYKMLKPIKKKDAITLSIEKDNPLDLLISVHQNGEAKPTPSSIKIIKSQVEEIASIEGYSDPIIATAKEFQKLKNLNKISEIVTVSKPSGSVIEFLCEKKGVFKKKVLFGDGCESDDDDDDENDENDENEEEEEVEEVEEQKFPPQTFDTESIIQLVKIATLSNTVQVYMDPGLPLKFRMNVGFLGHISILIKSKEMIALEATEDSYETGGGGEDDEEIKENESLAG